MRNSVRVLAGLLLAFAMALPPPVAAQQLVPRPEEFSALPLPVGSGARALGQGGAFTAVADDATAAVWNPAGLVQLERPEVSIVATYLTTTAEFAATTVTEDSGGVTRFAPGSDEKVQRSDLNFLSVTYPLTVADRNLVVSLNYHQRYDFHQELALSTSSILEMPGIGSSSLTQHYDLTAAGGVSAFSPAVAVQISPRLSLGATINFLGNEFAGGDAYTQDLHLTFEQINAFLGTSTTTAGRFSRHSVYDFSGINATFGAMWRPWQRGARWFSLAGVVETPYTAHVDRHVTTRWTDATLDGMPTAPDSVETSHERFAIDFPLSTTLGAALRLSDRTTVSVDAAWTEWSQWVQRDRATGDRTRPLAGAPASTEIDNLFTVRLGGEYVLSLPAGKLPLRAGLFYEPRPGLGNEQEIYGFGLGSGFTTPHFSLDAAYQYRTGNDLPGGNIGADVKGTSFDVDEHLFVASLIWYL